MAQDGHKQSVWRKRFFGNLKISWKKPSGGTRSVFIKAAKRPPRGHMRQIGVAPSSPATSARPSRSMGLERSAASVWILNVTIFTKKCPS
jgi:hypothetical protein